MKVGKDNLRCIRYNLQIFARQYRHIDKN